MSSLGDALDECAALRAQLAAVEREMDVLRKDCAHERSLRVTAEKDRDRNRGLAESKREQGQRDCTARVKAEAERDSLRADNAQLLADADADSLMLTQVGRERDAAIELVKALEEELMQAMSGMKFIDKALSNELRNHASTHERVKALEAALEPTAENIEALADVWTTDRIFKWPTTMAEQSLKHIRARAGLTKERE